MAKITYTDKVSIASSGNPDINTWRDNDANEVKAVVNSNDTVEVFTGNTTLYDRVQGRRYGSWATPIVGNITIDTTGAVEGGCAVIIWNGSSSPTFIGGIIQSYSGNITESGTYSIYVHHINGRFNINVFNVEGYTDVDTGFLLDTYTGSVGAWSLRNLSSSTTNVVRVRRDNDDAESDFTAAQITDGTLATWVGANNGYVHTLYDQSGNGNHVQAATNNYQPRLVNSGVVELTNGLPAVNFGAVQSGSGSGLVAGQTLSTGLFSIHTVSENTAVGSGLNQVFLTNHSGVANTGRTVYVQCQDAIDTKNVTFFNNGASQVGAYSTDWTNAQYLTSVYGDNSDYYVKQNGGSFEQVITGQALVQESTGLCIGNYSTVGGNSWQGKFQEVIIWASDKSADRTNIESEINSHYSVY